MKALFQFFIGNFPSLELIAWLFPVSLCWSFAALWLPGYLKKQYHWRTGYTRKLFHFLIFFTAVFFQFKFSLPGVFILGWAVTIAVFYACYKGSGNLFYEALAREKDEPYRTRYILYSYAATFTGGVLANLWFGKFAIFGYAITGIADAIAEPIGSRFGKHRYRVPSLDNKISYRSLEGSASVFISSLFISSLLIWFIPEFQMDYWKVLVAAIICTAVEAFSPSGFDNALLQISAGLLFYFWMS